MSEALADFAARIEHECHEDVPELASDEALWFVQPGEPLAKGLFYGFTRIGAYDTSVFPPAPLPDINAPDRWPIQIHSPVTVNGEVIETVSDHVAKHERIGHGSEALALRRGKHGYHPSDTTYDPTAFQEVLWSALRCSGTYLQHMNASVHADNSHEWWAEVIGTVFDRTREPYNTVIHGLFGGRMPLYGDSEVVAFVRDLLKEATVTDAAGAIWLPSPNFGPGPINFRYIVVHTTEGTDSRGYLCNPASQVSATYLTRDEAVYQLVREDDEAWDAGIIVGTPTTPLYDGVLVGFDALGRPVWSVNPNMESIGIEIEGTYVEDLTARPVFQRTVDLIKDIRSRRGLLPLVGHYQLSPGNRSDPGVANLEALIEATGGPLIMIDEATLRKILREEVTQPLAQQNLSGFNTVLKYALRRIARGLNSQRDPFVAYPDDDTPIT